VNIFAVDFCPLIAASQLCDQHVVKMVLETGQLLCTLLAHHGIATPYKPTHQGHPSNVWLRASRANAEWLVLHGLGMADEYGARYGKRHKSEAVIAFAERHIRNIDFPQEEELTPFALAMPEQFQVDCPVESYRNFYRFDKIRFARWKRNQPDWL
jgi:hypothetical protein